MFCKPPSGGILLHGSRLACSSAELLRSRKKYCHKIQSRPGFASVQFTAMSPLAPHSTAVWSSVEQPTLRQFQTIARVPAMRNLQRPVAFRGTGCYCTSANKDANGENIPEPSSQQLRVLFLHSAVPMVGFGCMDNLIMIQAGDFIDNTLGVALGLATLTAAAGGQIVSDFSGVLFGGTVEAAATKLGLPIPNLSAEQRGLKKSKLVATAGAAIGVVIGCCLGMMSLLFMDLEAAEHAKRMKELDTIFKSIMLQGERLLDAERSSLFLLDNKKGELYTKVASGDLTRLKGRRICISRTQDNGITNATLDSLRLLNVPDAYKDERFLNGTGPKTDEATGFRTRSMLVCPVLSSEGEAMAVLMALNKRGQPAFDSSDEKLMKMMAIQVSIYLEEAGFSP